MLWLSWWKSGTISWRRFRQVQFPFLWCKFQNCKDIFQNKHISRFLFPIDWVYHCGGPESLIFCSWPKSLGEFSTMDRFLSFGFLMNLNGNCSWATETFLLQICPQQWNIFSPIRCCIDPLTKFLISDFGEEKIKEFHWGRVFGRKRNVLMFKFSKRMWLLAGLSSQKVSQHFLWFVISCLFSSNSCDPHKIFIITWFKCNFFVIFFAVFILWFALVFSLCIFIVLIRLQSKLFLLSGENGRFKSADNWIGGSLRGSEFQYLTSEKKGMLESQCG